MPPPCRQNVLRAGAGVLPSVRLSVTGTDVVPVPAPCFPRRLTSRPPGSHSGMAHSHTSSENSLSFQTEEGTAGWYFARHRKIPSSPFCFPAIQTAFLSLPACRICVPLFLPRAPYPQRAAAPVRTPCLHRAAVSVLTPPLSAALHGSIPFSPALPGLSGLDTLLLSDR